MIFALIFIILFLTNDFLTFDWAGLFFKRKTEEPETKKDSIESLITGKKIYKPESGVSYLVPSGSETGSINDQGLNIFKELVFNNPPGCIISSFDPKIIIKRYRLADVNMIRLNSSIEPNTIPPNKLMTLVSAVDNFSNKHESVILFLGFEYLKKYVMFDELMVCIKDITKCVAKSKCSLLVSINIEILPEYKREQLNKYLVDIENAAWLRELAEELAECYQCGAIVKLTNDKCPECGAAFE
jgi:hypothetical protein